jgi:hypothetical protein
LECGAQAPPLLVDERLDLSRSELALNFDVRRRRVWLWVFGGICLLALVLGYLARPEDELSRLMELRPKVVRSVYVTTLAGPPEVTFLFSVPAETVKRCLPKLRYVGGFYGEDHPDYYLVWFPSGSSGFLRVHNGFPKGTTCDLRYQPYRPAPGMRKLG